MGAVGSFGRRDRATESARDGNLGLAELVMSLYPPSHRWSWRRRYGALMSSTSRHSAADESGAKAAPTLEISPRAGRLRFRLAIKWTDSAHEYGIEDAQHAIARVHYVEERFDDRRSPSTFGPHSSSVLSGDSGSHSLRSSKSWSSSRSTTLPPVRAGQPSRPPWAARPRPDVHYSRSTRRCAAASYT